MSKNQEYVEQYAEYAMEQMRRYGIPASVTLAQGICESASGQSELSRKGNNHFGIKATSGWVQNGGKYLVYTDDRPNEKFCQYASVGDSYEHHSRFLKGNKRYSSLFKLSLMTTRDGQTGCRTPAMPPTRSTLQVFKASSRRTTCRSMTRWSGRSELQQGQAREKTAG